MKLKQLLPMTLRHALRPSYQKLQRSWHESAWSAKPASWTQARARAHAETNFERLLGMASDEFGITQMPVEIDGLIQRLNARSARSFIEVGTHKGGNSFLFSHAVPTNQMGIGVDLCVQNAAKLKHFIREGQRYHALHGDSQTVRMRDQAAAFLGGNLVDFLFIDGDHGYAGVKADFELYSPLVRPGGLIAFHDICPDHKTLYGAETGCYAGEVYQYWAELKQQFPDHEELIQSPGQDGFGIGLLTWPGPKQ